MADEHLFFAYLFVTLLLICNSGLLIEAERTNKFHETKPSNINQKNDARTVPEKLERRILDMFGFKQRPNVGKDLQVPRLMQHLFKSHMGDYFDDQENLLSDWETGFDLPPDDVTSRVNTARSFHHIGKDESFPGMPDHHIRLKFNLTTIPHDEVVGASDLLLHREAIASHVLAVGPPLYRINIYQIIKPPDPRPEKVSSTVGKWKSNPSSSGAITRLLDTRVVDTTTSTWEKFDVSLATMSWAHNDHTENHGLLVEIVEDGNAQTPSKQDRKHVRLKRDLHEEIDDAEWQHKRPTLVTYTHDGKATNLRRRRSRSKRNSRKKDTNSSRKKRKKKRRRPCARHNLYVDFSEVGWHDWIVAPHGYDAFYCQGQCLFPLAEHLNATNHAIVQTLTHSVEPSMVPSPCCVPTELSSISMLYVDEHNLVVLKSYPKMAVEACGCR